MKHTITRPILDDILHHNFHADMQLDKESYPFVQIENDWFHCP